MKRILIFGGTTEGRLLADKLVRSGCSVTVSVATELGAEELADITPLTVLVGRKQQAEMEEILPGFDLCIDATHPYAVKATETIRTACQQTHVPLRRLLRPESQDQADVSVSSPEEAADYLKCTTGNILLTTGTKELAAFSSLEAKRLFARVLPTHQALDACEALGLPHRNILALQGPFSRELNLAMLKQYSIRWLVTKDGGAAGGFGEKLEAAHRAGARLVLIRRPQEQGMTMEEILQELLEKKA
jgi:precorrin-6x reductase